MVLSGAPAGVGQFLGLATAGTLLYTGGMFLNDAFDAEYDKQARAERPIPSGDIDVQTVFIAGFGQLAAAALLALVLAATGVVLPRTLIVVTGLSAAIVGYDAWHKRNPVAPFLMGACRMGLYWLGALAIAPKVPLAPFLASGLLLFYVAGITYVARHEGRTAIGKSWPLALLLAPLGCVGLPLLQRSALSLFVFMALAIWVGRAVSKIRRGGPDNIKSGVIALIGGISLVDALFLAGMDTRASLLAMVAFGVSMALQRSLPGT